MDEIKKDSWEFLKIKLDFLKPFLTTLLLLNAGLISYIFVNFNKNGLFLNFCVIFAIIIVSILFAVLLNTSLKVLEEMKGLL